MCQCVVTVVAVECVLSGPLLVQSHVLLSGAPRVFNSHSEPSGDRRAEAWLYRAAFAKIFGTLLDYGCQTATITAPCVKNDSLDRGMKAIRLERNDCVPFGELTSCQNATATNSRITCRRSARIPIARLVAPSCRTGFPDSDRFEKSSRNRNPSIVR